MAIKIKKIKAAQGPQDYMVDLYYLMLPSANLAEQRAQGNIYALSDLTKLEKVINRRGMQSGTFEDPILDINVYGTIVEFDNQLF